VKFVILEIIWIQIIVLNVEINYFKNFNLNFKKQENIFYIFLFFCLKKG